MIQEESRRKAQNANASGSLSTINKFSMMKKYKKHCAKCGKNNHNTKDHWDTPPQRQGGGSGSGGGSKKKSGQQRKKRGSSAKGKKPVAGQKQIMDRCINVLKIVDVPESDFSSESINFSCYVQKDMSKWLMDLGCSKHVTSHITNYIKYTPFNSPGKAEITDKELDILGVGTIAICHTMMDRNVSNITLLQVLFVPTTNRQFYSTCIATEKGCEARQTRSSHDVYSLDGTRFITRTRKTTSRLFFFKAEVLRKQDSKVMILVLKLNTHDLWHQCLGHANSQVIKALLAHVIGGPATGAASPPTGLCKGCEKGKSKQLPFPPLKSRAETTLALVHSDLDEMSTASIDGYKWTATYLNDHTVKSELRYPIIQAIRSQWESQDLPALGNQYHMTDDTASQE